MVKLTFLGIVIGSVGGIINLLWSRLNMEPATIFEDAVRFSIVDSLPAALVSDWWDKNFKSIE
jgi:hypothetical protein